MDKEYGLGLLWSTQACFSYYALLLMLATFTTYFIIKSLNKHDIEKHAKPKLPPGPEPWPIVGNLPEMLANKPALRWIHKLMSDMDTDIACIRLGYKFLKKQDANNFASRPLSMASNLISSGYLSAALVPYGQQWKKMKKIVRNEVISPLRLKWLHDKRIEEADNLVRYVYGLCNYNDGLVNVKVVAQRYCGNVVRKMFFNKRYFGERVKNGGPGFEEEEHMDAVFTLLYHLYAFCVPDFMPCLRGVDLDGHEKKVKKALGIMRKYHDPVIKDRIHQWKQGRKEEVKDWLDVLITLRDAYNNHLLTSEEIKAFIKELMIASVDNPSNAVEWAIAEMINQPILLKRAINELDNVVGNDRLVQESDLCKLNYLKACLKEAFRLHPISLFIPPHVCMVDTMVANYFIPKGSHVLISRRRLDQKLKV